MSNWVTYTEYRPGVPMEVISWHENEEVTLRPIGGGEILVVNGSFVYSVKED